VILAGALLLRLPLLPLPLTLSDDALRYLWDGRVAAAGFNPYRVAPDAETLAPLRNEAWWSMPHRKVPTVYPPLSVAAFSIAARLPFPMLAWKLLILGADLAGCALLLRLARRLGRPEASTVWYAWNPLVALECAGMAHLDALGVVALLATLLLLTRPRPAAAAVAAAAATGVMIKLVPLAALPMWARQSGRGLRTFGIASALLAAAFVPVLWTSGGAPPGLVRFAVSWEYNGPLFEPLWRLLEAAGLAPALARLLDAFKGWSGWYTLPNPLYPLLYPQLLAKGLLAVGVVAAVLRSLRERDPVGGTGRLFGALLLLSATVYPWYLLWVLPLAALFRQTAWIALSALVLLSYLPQHTGVPLFPWVYAAIWIPFAALLVRERQPWSSA
jgi:hypothetical protein